MRKITVLCLCLVITAFSFTPILANAQQRTPGVAAGNTFRYTYSFEYNLNNSTANDFFPSGILDAVFEQAQSIEWGQLSVKNVDGSIVTAETLLHFKNGTEQSTTTSTDISVGGGNLTLFFIAANLNANDPIYLNENEQKINETITRNYPTGPRQLNHQNIISEYNVSDDELAGFNMSIGFKQINTQDILWDKQLGVLVEMSYDMVTQSEALNANIALKISLMESNVLTIPEFPTSIGLISALAAVLIIAFVYKKKTPSPSSSKPQP